MRNVAAKALCKPCPNRRSSFQARRSYGFFHTFWCPPFLSVQAQVEPYLQAEPFLVYPSFTLFLRCTTQCTYWYYSYLVSANSRHLTPMPKARKKKLPVTVNQRPTGVSSNPHSSRTVIRRFHVLLKQKTQLENGPGSATIVAQLTNIQREIEELGGLEAYQRMSAIGQGSDRGGGSEKFLIPWLKEVAAQKELAEKKLRSVSTPKIYSTYPINPLGCSKWVP